MKIAVLFDGGGLARLGLERAGHECTGYEIDPVKHYLSRFVGSGRCVLCDVTRYDFSRYDAVWASPPCQIRSPARTQGAPVSPYSVDLVDFSLSLSNRTLWVECVPTNSPERDSWGLPFNAAQFLETPIQSRNRIIGGRYFMPAVFRRYRRTNPEVCPCITASEYRGCATDTRRASRWYGRKLTPDECAYHQGFTIPENWKHTPRGFTESQWRQVIYETIGNGVPVYMAQAFGMTADNKLAPPLRCRFPLQFSERDSRPGKGPRIDPN